MGTSDSGEFVEALHGSPELQFIANSIPGPVAYLDHELRYRFTNDTYDRLLPMVGAEFDRSSVLGRNIEEVYGEALASVIRPNLERALTGETFTVEVSFAGSQSLNSYIPHFVNGEINGVLLVAQDISELHQSRVALIQSERMASLGRLVAGLLHEINSPLGAIKGALNVLHSGLEKAKRAPLDSKRIDTMLRLTENATEAVQRVGEMTQQLRSFSRLDQQEAQDADLVEGLETTLGLMSGELEGRIDVVREYTEIPRVRCRPQDINQVFAALLSNAIAAIEGAGTITLRSRCDVDSVTLEIEDDGVGIASDQLERIFDPAFANTERRVKAGLGLFVSRSIVDAHKGALRAKSDPGRGACFELTLPRKA